MYKAILGLMIGSITLTLHETEFVSAPPLLPGVWARGENLTILDAVKILRDNFVPPKELNITSTCNTIFFMRKGTPPSVSIKNNHPVCSLRFPVKLESRFCSMFTYQLRKLYIRSCRKICVIFNVARNF